MKISTVEVVYSIIYKDSNNNIIEYTLDTPDYLEKSSNLNEKLLIKPDKTVKVEGIRPTNIDIDTNSYTVYIKEDNSDVINILQINKVKEVKVTKVDVNLETEYLEMSIKPQLDILTKDTPKNYTLKRLTLIVIREIKQELVRIKQLGFEKVVKDKVNLVEIIGFEKEVEIDYLKYNIKIVLENKDNAIIMLEYNND